MNVKSPDAFVFSVSALLIHAFLNTGCGCTGDDDKLHSRIQRIWLTSEASIYT